MVDAEIKTGTIMLYGGKPAEIIRVCADNTADIEVPMDWGLMTGNVPLSKLSPYDGEPIEINAERLSGKCPHNSILIEALNLSQERADEIKKDVIDSLNYYLCIACTIDYVTHKYGGVERTYAGYVIGALAEQQEQKKQGLFLNCGDDIEKKITEKTL
jgi:hypothetical protein